MASIKNDRTMVWTVPPGPSTGLGKPFKAWGMYVGPRVSPLSVGYNLFFI